MAITNCLMMMTLFGVAFGQYYHLDVFGIYENGIQFFGSTIGQAPFFNQSSSMCYNGRDIYYSTYGGISVINPTVKQSTTFRNEDGILYDNVDCCCDIVAFGHYVDNKTYIVEVEFLSRNVSQLYTITSGISSARVKIDCDRGTLYVIGLNSTWIYNLNGQNTSHVTYSELVKQPVCVGVYTDPSNNTHIFITFSKENFRTTLVIVDIHAGTTTTKSFVAAVYCITIQDGVLYGVGFSGTQRYLFQLNPESIINEVSDISVTRIVPDTVYYLIDDINGISYCSNCTTGCMDINCTSCSNACGFCSPNTGNCECDDSNVDACVYKNTALKEECRGPQSFPDAACIVKNPIAKRRVGLDITVIGFYRNQADISVTRLVKTGRWDISALPEPMVAVTNGNVPAGISLSGFSAPVPDKARGRRFGVYTADIIPSDPMIREVNIPCIVTENSGFYNVQYTYTVSVGGNVTLTATFDDTNQKLSNYKESLLWIFTRPGDDPVPIGWCNELLSCTVTAATEGDEGVYEVYRQPRYKRTWHPIFYLFVRKCQPTKWGPACDKDCPICEQGTCDAGSGTCICYPGWTGDLCNSECGPGQIGQNCDISCGDLFPGTTGCENLSICLPGKAGCFCYKGLNPPECI